MASSSGAGAGGGGRGEDLTACSSTRMIQEDFSVQNYDWLTAATGAEFDPKIAAEELRIAVPP